MSNHQTDNHKLNVPSEGATDWGTLLNANFAAIDTGLEIRDSRTNLDNYAPVESARFLATDTGETPSTTGAPADD